MLIRTLPLRLALPQRGQLPDVQRTTAVPTAAPKVWPCPATAERSKLPHARWHKASEQAVKQERAVQSTTVMIEVVDVNSRRLVKVGPRLQRWWRLWQRSCWRYLIRVPLAWNAGVIASRLEQGCSPWGRVCLSNTAHQDPPALTNAMCKMHSDSREDSV